MTRAEIAQLQSRPPRPLLDQALMVAVYAAGPAVWALTLYLVLR